MKTPLENLLDWEMNFTIKLNNVLQLCEGGD